MRRARQAKIGRNDPCPFGSGKKYKKWSKGSGADRPTAAQAVHPRKMLRKLSMSP
ncbi:MAG: SEC-C metal-binding domain-containing protein [Terriglobales bacterium]